MPKEFNLNVFKKASLARNFEDIVFTKITKQGD